MCGADAGVYVDKGLGEDTQPYVSGGARRGAVRAKTILEEGLDGEKGVVTNGCNWVVWVFMELEGVGGRDWVDLG